LQARFSNVPANVRIYVSAHSLNNCAGGSATATNSFCSSETSGATAYAVSPTIGQPATIILNPTSTAETWLGPNSILPVAGQAGGGGFPAGALAGAIEVPIVSGTGTFIWEIFSQNPNTIDTVSFSVALAYRNVNNPGTGTVNVNGSFAPISTDNKMSSSSPL